MEGETKSAQYITDKNRMNQIKKYQLDKNIKTLPETIDVLVDKALKDEGY